ncbi:LegC family aminotransferase [Desulfosediminicola ganghwensis]|uniref:LegC family aminotransferase n=1 Tax=Desulfosediminicola ganghwensis TaxID=2569540 RepID=UPI0010AC19DA|nr:LegC family aminotransferase [Desulfosediminicola ganghwensis]
MADFHDIVDFVRASFAEPDAFIPLHDPRFVGNEKRYLNECIDSNFVSSVGAFVGRFEEMCAEFTGARFAVAAMNGTAALHMALQLVGVRRGDEVLTQALTFIATANAISYTGAEPVFLDVDRDTLGLSPDALAWWLEANVELKAGIPINRTTQRRVAACVPMHTFGHPAKLGDLELVLDRYGIPMVEDSAESIGSYYKGQHTGTTGKLGVLSFNGNKLITTGGGGMILTDDEGLAQKAKHLTTQAKIPHSWEFVHDQIGYNYRLTNVNAAIGCAQMEQLEYLLGLKRELAEKYRSFFEGTELQFVSEPVGCKSNYWLNAVLTKDREQRDELLKYTNKHGVMTRPIWELMSRLPMFKDCQNDGLVNSIWLADRVVNIPSGAPIRGYGKNIA